MGADARTPAEASPADEGSAKATTGALARRKRPRRRRHVFAGIGLVVVLVAADAAAGLAWDRFHGTAPQGPIAQVSDAIGGPSTPFHDERADTPAMAGSPWRDDYFAEMREIRYEYWPFLLNRPLTFHGTYFNMEGWSRETWQPPDDGEPMPAVWFLGGSALWGEGQRDLHTIPSEVARLAAADGLPIRATNYGQSGWVLHQERTLLEQLLADDALNPPDLVAFYDGANEVSVQAQLPAAVAEDPLAPAPAHFGVDRAMEVTDGTSGSTTTSAPSPDVWADLLDAYQRRSFVLRGFRALGRALGGDPAGAAGADDDAAAERAAAVYLEDRAATEATVADAGAVPFFFWQPEGLEVPGYRAAAERVGPPTVDLTDVLRGREDEVFMDLVHTNEDGARAVAAEVYASMKPAIEAWYQAHR